MGTFILESPLTLQISAKKKFSLNLNVYRNTHYQTLNRAKRLYKEHMKAQILELPKLKQIEVRYTVFPKTRRLFDLGNVCSVVDKFFLDALVELGILVDDNYTIVTHTTNAFGEVCKHNPHVRIQIRTKTNEH